LDLSGERRDVETIHEKPEPAVEPQLAGDACGGEALGAHHSTPIAAERAAM